MLIINFLSTPNVSWSGYAPGCMGCWCRIDGRKSAWRYRKLVCQHDNIYKYNILAMKTMKIVTWISNVVTHGRYLQDQRIPPKGPRDVYFIFSSLSLSLYLGHLPRRRRSPARPRSALVSLMVAGLIRPLVRNPKSHPFVHTPPTRALTLTRAHTHHLRAHDGARRSAVPTRVPSSTSAITRPGVLLLFFHYQYETRFVKITFSVSSNADVVTCFRVRKYTRKKKKRSVGVSCGYAGPLVARK